jgi:hypothetical protein
VKSRRAAERVMKSTTDYLEGKLKLKVNQDKSQVGSPLKLKVLGFSLWKINGKTGIRPHGKSLKRFKDKVIEITKRNCGRSVKSILEELRRYTMGWLGYYSVASLASKTQQLDGWIRARLRQYIWKQWKRVKTRFKNLKKHGVSEEQAWQWANTRKGYWRTSHSPILMHTLTNDYFKKLGYDELKGRYEGITNKRKATLGY